MPNPMGTMRISTVPALKGRNLFMTAASDGLAHLQATTRVRGQIPSTLRRGQ
jgi:hypothetical protein